MINTNLTLTRLALGPSALFFKVGDIHTRFDTLRGSPGQQYPIPGDLNVKDHFPCSSLCQILFDCPSFS